MESREVIDSKTPTRGPIESRDDIYVSGNTDSKCVRFRDVHKLIVAGADLRDLHADHKDTIIDLWEYSGELVRRMNLPKKPMGYL